MLDIGSVKISIPLDVLSPGTVIPPFSESPPSNIPPSVVISAEYKWSVPSPPTFIAHITFPSVLYFTIYASEDPVLVTVIEFPEAVSFALKVTLPVNCPV